MIKITGIILKSILLTKGEHNHVMLVLFYAGNFLKQRLCVT